MKIKCYKYWMQLEQINEKKVFASCINQHLKIYTQDL